MNVDMIVSTNGHLVSAWKGFREILFEVRSNMEHYNINEVSFIYYIETIA